MLPDHPPGDPRPTHGPGSFHDRPSEWQPPSHVDETDPVVEGAVGFMVVIYVWLLVLILVLLAQWTHLV
jgi:hypothetical protein